MEAVVEVERHPLNQANELVDVLACFRDVLLETDAGVPARIKVLLIDLATLVLIEMAAKKHSGRKLLLFGGNALADVDLEPAEKRFANFGQVVKLMSVTKSRSSALSCSTGPEGSG